MNHQFSEAQLLLRQSVAEFFSREYPLDRLRLFHEAPAERQRELWEYIGSLGWGAAPFPEAIAGIDGSFLDAAVILEEMGRAAGATPFPHSTVAAGMSLVDASPDLAGQVAESEATVIWCPETPANTLTFANGALSGRSVGVLWPELATHFLVPISGHGVAVFAAAQTGVTAAVLDTSSLEPAGAVTFENATPAALLDGSVADDVLINGAAANALVLLGASERALDLAVEYAKERVQFGQPIGSFQAIQHKAADMHIAIEVGRNLAYKAATLHGTPDFARAARFAKANLNDAGTFVTRQAIQIHGGVGFSDNHPVQLAFRLAMSATGVYGTAHEHRREITELVLAS